MSINTKSRPPSTIAFAKAIADPTRQQIMQLTCCTWLSVNEIVSSVGVSQPTVSHHLSVLKTEGLVKKRTEGKHIYYSLNQEKIANCCNQLIQVFAPESNSANLIEINDL